MYKIAKRLQHNQSYIRLAEKYNNLLIKNNNLERQVDILNNHINYQKIYIPDIEKVIIDNFMNFSTEYNNRTNMKNLNKE